MKNGHFIRLLAAAWLPPGCCLAAWLPGCSASKPPGCLSAYRCFPIHPINHNRSKCSATPPKCCSLLSVQQFLDAAVTVWHEMGLHWFVGGCFASVMISKLWLDIVLSMLHGALRSWRQFAHGSQQDPAMVSCAWTRLFLPGLMDLILRPHSQSGQPLVMVWTCFLQKLPTRTLSDLSQNVLPNQRPRTQRQNPSALPALRALCTMSGAAPRARRSSWR